MRLKIADLPLYSGIYRLSVWLGCGTENLDAALDIVSLDFISKGCIALVRFHGFRWKHEGSRRLDAGVRGAMKWLLISKGLGTGYTILGSGDGMPVEAKAIHLRPPHPQCLGNDWKERSLCSSCPRLGTWRIRSRLRTTFTLRSTAVDVGGRIGIELRTTDAHVHIGPGVWIMRGVRFICFRSIFIASDGTIGDGCILLDSDIHDFTPGLWTRNRLVCRLSSPRRPILVPHVIVRKGERKSAPTIVGNQSVVQRSIPDLCVAAGNPARILLRYAGAKNQHES